VDSQTLGYYIAVTLIAVAINTNLICSAKFTDMSTWHALCQEQPDIINSTSVAILDSIAKF
jgi:hypothetical protein